MRRRHSGLTLESCRHVLVVLKAGAVSDLMNGEICFEQRPRKKIESGKASFTELETLMLDKGEASANTSGRQELLENIVHRHIDIA